MTRDVQEYISRALTLAGQVEERNRAARARIEAFKDSSKEVTEEFRNKLQLQYGIDLSPFLNAKFDEMEKEQLESLQASAKKTIQTITEILDGYLQQLGG